MTLDDLLTLPLAKRIIWLHSADGPKGKLSHDKFAEALGIPNRQTIIGWEKSRREPSAENAERLAAFSGFPAWVFRRREAEEAALEMFGRRLGELEAEQDEMRALLLQAFDLIRKLDPLSPAAEDGAPVAQPQHAQAGKRRR